METHHQTAIEDFLKLYRDKPEFIAILLAGSLAHGYAKPDSDIDIMLVADEREYAKRKADGKLAFSLWDICTYPGGYIDCKVVSLVALAEIADRGSDAARYAFKDAKILAGATVELAAALAKTCRFPQEKQADRQYRFVCQLLAWKWYMSQAVAKQNAYLVHLAAHKVILFACRIILNLNQMLYPYHKWLLEETKRAPRQPAEFQKILAEFAQAPDFGWAQSLTDAVLAFIGVAEPGTDWPNRFMADSELNWLDHEPPVDDL